MALICLSAAQCEIQCELNGGSLAASLKPPVRRSAKHNAVSTQAGTPYALPSPKDPAMFSAITSSPCFDTSCAAQQSVGQRDGTGVPGRALQPY